jgi:hypothetical protein
VRILWDSVDCRTICSVILRKVPAENLPEKFRTFTEKRTESAGKFAAGTFRRMQEKFLTVQT